jgi:hypothetical protein
MGRQPARWLEGREPRLCLMCAIDHATASSCRARISPRRRARSATCAFSATSSGRKAFRTPSMAIATAACDATTSTEHSRRSWQVGKSQRRWDGYSPIYASRCSRQLRPRVAWNACRSYGKTDSRQTPALTFLRFVLDSNQREPSLLGAARPIWAACARREAPAGGFRRADDFEVVGACDRSLLLEYGVTKTRV